MLEFTQLMRALLNELISLSENTLSISIAIGFSSNEMCGG